MHSARGLERVQTIVIGGGQAGLSVGYHLAKCGLPFLILDASERIGDAWRQRWDSLRLFTPARFDGLDGMPFPTQGDYFPTKDEMAGYLESYAARFDLPLWTGVKVDSLCREGGHFMVTAGDKRFEAENVVVAMSKYQKEAVPAYASGLQPGIFQLHSLGYRGPSQLQEGDVLIVGAANSGADIAMEVSKEHRVWLSGRHPGHIPFRIEWPASRILLSRFVLRVVFHHVMTVRTPMGRRLREKSRHHGLPLIRVKPADLVAARVERVPRVVGARDGMPLLADGRVMDVANVVWCTGFHPDFSWIDLPVFDGDGQPVHYRGVVRNEPGLYFVGLDFIYSVSSAMVHGVGRDAEYVVRHIARQQDSGRRRALAGVALS